MLLKVVGWLLGLVSVAFVGYYFDNGHIFSGVLCIFAIGFFIPPILNKINANAKKTAEEKGKKHQDLTLKSSIFGGVVLFFIALFIAAPSDESTTKQTAIENTNKSNIAVKAQRTEPFIYIDEINKLNSIVENLFHLYQPPYSEYKRFAIMKKNIERKISPICNYLDTLVKSTKNRNSPYFGDFQDCREVELSLFQVLMNIRDNNYQSIEKYNQTIIAINKRLLKKIDDHKAVPEFLRKN
jgi:hypothetical protein